MSVAPNQQREHSSSPTTADDTESPILRMLHRDYDRRRRLQSSESLAVELESLRFQREEYRELIQRAPETVRFAEDILAYLDQMIADVEAALAERERLIARNQELERYRIHPDRRRSRFTHDAKDLKRLWPIRDFVERVMCVDLGDGAHPKGRCPLPDHTERSPSFTVYPESDSWHCFGCDRGGDIFTLAALYFNLDPIREFPEVVRRVADATPGLLGGG